MAALFAQTAGAEVQTLPGTVVAEVETDRTLISKPGWLRGLHFSGTPVPDDARPQMYAVLPRDWADSAFCARITSIGGGY